MKRGYKIVDMYGMLVLYQACAKSSQEGLFYKRDTILFAIDEETEPSNT